MRILSLFDGISCGMVALERANIPVDKYMAYEIDKYAVSISEKNYPQVKHCGSVVDADFTQYKGFDLLIGGSPCQDLSCAGKRAGLNGSRSSLFYEYVRALSETNPAYFLFENVASMGKANKEIISKELGVEPIQINSALLSAQSRKRLYWTNIPNVTLPEDKGILLQDILEYGISYSEKSCCITSRYQGMSFERDFIRRQRTGVAQPVCMRYVRTETGKKLRKDYEAGIIKHGYNEHCILSPRTDGKASTLCSTLNNEHIICIPSALRNRGNGKQVELRSDNKANCLTGVMSDSMVSVPVRIGNINNSNSQGHRVYSVKGKSISLSANGGGMGAKTGLYKIDLPDGDYIIRKLTPVECERLQTLPDNYTKGVSNTQRYKMLGNGWTVDVIAHILRNIR